MQDFILRNWSIVRTGTTASQKSLFFNLRRLRARINDTGDATMTSENRSYVARQLGVPERDVDKMASRLYGADRSLNAPMGESGEGGEWQDLLPDDSPDPELQLMDEKDGQTRKKWLIEAMKTLNDRELTIIRERRLTDESITLEALGKRLGISKERVRQIEHAALKKLKLALMRIVGDPEDSGLMPNY
jgi:RNA polymerase sigma-32 factor